MKVIKFYADWCGPCSGLSKIIEGAKDKINITIENVNIDEDSEMVTKYQIRSVPTMVMVDGDTEIKRKVGTMGEKDLLNFLKV